jgi:hypothetical protein
MISADSPIVAEGRQLSPMIAATDLSLYFSEGPKSP